MKKFALNFINKNNILLIITLVIYLAVGHALNIGCVIKFLTGVSCPGCGMTRAWLSLLRMDIRAVYYYHPLFLFPIIYFLLTYLNKYKLFKRYNYVIYILIFIFLVVYLLRMIDSSNDIVIFNIRDGLIYKFIHIRRLSC